MITSSGVHYLTFSLFLHTGDEMLVTPLQQVSEHLPMAMHADVAAGSFLKFCCIFVFTFFFFFFFFFFLTESCISNDRNTIINIGKGSVGTGLNAADPETVSANSISR